MDNNSNNNNSSLAKFSFIHKPAFTIIEVIIVLVIGAVIMLTVFLVVPQLQRTQRNSRRQADARRVFLAAEQFAASNQGTYPTQANSLGIATTCSGSLIATTCGPIANITGTVVAPSGTTYTIPTASLSTPGENAMTILYTGASGNVIGCTSSTGGTLAGSAAGAATGTNKFNTFIVGVTQETATSVTGSSFCLTN